MTETQTSLLPPPGPEVRIAIMEDIVRLSAEIAAAKEAMAQYRRDIYRMEREIADKALELARLPVGAGDLRKEPAVAQQQVTDPANLIGPKIAAFAQGQAAGARGAGPEANPYVGAVGEAWELGRRGDTLDDDISEGGGLE